MLQWWVDYLDVLRNETLTPFDYVKINKGKKISEN